jgi:hypothetical protein
MDSVKSLYDLFKETKIDTKTYVYFDQETGRIEKVGAWTQDDSYSYITVDPSKVAPIMQGEKGLDDFTVEYDIVTKKLNLKEIKRAQEEDERSIVTFKEISKHQKTKKVDVLLQQDFANSTWIVTLSDKIIENLKKESVRITTNLFFSITRKNDPNILYRTISCSIGNLIEHGSIYFPFNYQFEFDKTEISVYTSTYFDVYKYEVLDEKV